jgi:hypothetical protein
MHSNFVNSSKRTRVINSTAAGTNNVNGTVIDMQDFDSVVFEVLFGALTATQVTETKIQGGNLANGSDMTDLAATHCGPLGDSQSNFMLVTDVVKPAGFRYLRVVVVRGTANAAIDGAVAVQYNAHKAPQTDDASTVSAQLTVVSPIAGTA